MNLLRNQLLAGSWLVRGAIIIMAINHLIGIVGLNNNKFQPFFESLSGINLLLSFLIVLAFQVPLNMKLLWFSFLGFLAGMGAEIIGVNSGYPFGVYYYTSVFGMHVYGVPVIIGINWILLSYVTGVWANSCLKDEWQKILFASLLMVVTDLLLEGFATRHHLWIWQNNIPPVQNYISWFIISVGIQLVFRKLIPGSTNPVASGYLIILFLFLFTDLLLAAAL